MGTGALCAADSRLTGATLLAVGTCAPCADGTYGANDAANCALNAVCGKQVLNAATRVNVAATRLVVGTCDACAADTWALTIADNCVANTVCGYAVGTSGALRTSADATREVAGTCANCAAESYDATEAFNGNCVAQTAKGACTGNLLAGGARFTAATPTKDSVCAPCAAGSYGAVDGSANCLAQPTCGAQLAAGCAAGVTRSNAATAGTTTLGVCDACSDNTFAPDGPTSCLANAVCGANRVDVVATRKLIGTCKDCLANTWALLKSEACIANTVCGVAVTGNPALRTSADASRTVAGTCADCADGSYSATATGACVAQTIKGTCTGKLLAVGNADGSVDCLIQPTCGNQLATTGDAGCTVAVPRGTGFDSVTTVGTCAPCSDNTFAPDDATSCLANAVCGANRVDVVATRKLIGTCKDCLANT